VGSNAEVKSALIEVLFLPITRFIIFLSIVTLARFTVAADSVPTDVTKALAATVGSFKATSPLVADNLSSTAHREYKSANGERFSATAYTAKSDSGAYAIFLTQVKTFANSGQLRAGAEAGTRSVVTDNQAAFFKGPVCVVIKSAAKGDRRAALLDLAKQLAAPLNAGEGEIPVLVRHLPNWESVELQASYAVAPDQLKTIVPNPAAVEAVRFDGGTEAVVAPYDSARLLLVEFTTPQLATENDQHIGQTLQQLRAQGQPVPTSYRRVGNYSVFVFDAANEQTANNLIDQIKYEQVVQWLGENPNWLKRAQKEYTETTLNMLVTVVKTSGLAAAICFGVGGFFGAVLFARRRAQQANAEAYSDAGGMMRLNLDELSAQTNPGKLIGSGSSEKN